MEYFSFKFEGFFRISFSVPWLSDRCSGFRFQFSYEINCGTGIKRIFKKFAIFIVFFYLYFVLYFSKCSEEYQGRIWKLTAANNELLKQLAEKEGMA
jgi:hypothetical protein